MSSLPAQLHQITTLRRPYAMFNRFINYLIYKKDLEDPETAMQGRYFVLTELISARHTTPFAVASPRPNPVMLCMMPCSKLMRGPQWKAASITFRSDRAHAPSGRPER